MERFLVTLSLGPVRSLIGAARRTRDLWCGSWLLSEAARAAARVLHQRQPGCLIFPCPEYPDTDLDPQDEPGDAANVANVLRGEVSVPDAPAARALCEAAKSAARSRLTALGDSARSELGRMGRPVREKVWQAQIGDVLEGFAAWVSIPAGGADDTGDGYARASRRLGGVLAARKATRDFRACKPLSAEGLCENGWSPPRGDRRTHVAIDPSTGAADTGRLFQTEGIDLDAPTAARDRGSPAGEGSWPASSAM